MKGDEPCGCPDCSCRCITPHGSGTCWLCRQGYHRMTAQAPVEMRLTPAEKDLAQRTAAARARYHAKGKTRDQYGAETRTIDQVAACAAEIAVGRYLELPISRTITSGPLPQQADVGANVEVRFSSTPFLIAHPDDHDDWIMVLVRAGLDGSYRLMGWCSGEYAKQDHWWRPKGEVPHEAYFVPMAVLASMKTLRVEDGRAIG